MHDNSVIAKKKYRTLQYQTYPARRQTESHQKVRLKILNGSESRRCEYRKFNGQIVIIKGILAIS